MKGYLGFKLKIQLVCTIKPVKGYQLKRKVFYHVLLHFERYL